MERHSAPRQPSAGRLPRFSQPITGTSTFVQRNTEMSFMGKIILRGHAGHQTLTQPHSWGKSAVSCLYPHTGHSCWCPSCHSKLGTHAQVTLLSAVRASCTPNSTPLSCTQGIFPSSPTRCSLHMLPDGSGTPEYKGSSCLRLPKCWDYAWAPHAQGSC